MLAVNIENTEIVSVSELSLAIKNAVERNFSYVKVRGEISGFKLHSSGHSYFAIKDKDSVLDAIMWRGTKTSSAIQDGLEVVATGKITTYGARSKYQMTVAQIEPAGEGALLKILQERKIKFQKEGLFDKKRPIPKFPKRIGVVTSATGAVIKDILHRIDARFACNVLLWPVAVQGVGSADQIANAIKGFSLINKKPDLIIVARGGGSLEDLWSFNEEIVVRATAASDIPIISAVGHETDFTLIDFAADLRAPTPTAAAEIATPDGQNLKIFLKEIDAKINRSFKQIFEICSLKLISLMRALPDLPSIMAEKNQRLDDLTERLIYCFLNIFKHKKSDLDKHKLPSLQQQIIAAESNLKNISSIFIMNIKSFMENKEQTLKWHDMVLMQNSYKRTLEKGFCLVSNGNNIVSSVEDMKKNHRVDLVFHDGKVEISVI